jgi:hypothetical protein
LKVSLVAVVLEKIPNLLSPVHSSDDEVWLYGEVHPSSKTSAATTTSPSATTSVTTTAAGSNGVGYKKKNSSDLSNVVTVRADINKNIDVSDVDSDDFLDFGELQTPPARH